MKWLLPKLENMHSIQMTTHDINHLRLHFLKLTHSYYHQLICGTIQQKEKKSYSMRPLNGVIS